MSVTGRNAGTGGTTFTWNTSTTAKASEQTPRHCIVPDTTGGLSVYRSIDVGTTGASVSTSASQIYGWYLFNAASSIRYVKLYNKATAPTVGTDTPVMTIPLPASGGANVFGEIGVPFSLGIGIGATTGIADNNTDAPTANDVVAHIFYKAA